MTVSSKDFLLGSYNATRLLGDKAITSDATMVIDGFETLALLTKQFPWPVLSTQGEIEVPTPMGSALWQAQQLKVQQQGPIQFMETISGEVDKFLKTVASNSGAKFNCTVYEGTLDKFHRACKLRDCFVQLDAPDRDWESRAQILLVTGTIFFHYFGEDLPGNIV